jgi:transposase-like protein
MQRTTRVGWRRRTRAQRDTLLAAYQRSGLSQKDFAAQAGIGYSTLTSWLGKAAAGRAASLEDGPSGFIPVPNLLAPAERVANLLTITTNYREVWKEFFRSAELVRVIDPSSDVAKRPVTPEEEFFVSMVISHTSSMYEALKDELVTKQEGLRRNVGSFFSLPIPQAVWKKTKIYQNGDFVAFVEKCLHTLLEKGGM